MSGLCGNWGHIHQGPAQSLGLAPLRLFLHSCTWVAGSSARAGCSPAHHRYPRKGSPGPPWPLTETAWCVLSAAPQGGTFTGGETGLRGEASHPEVMGWQSGGSVRCGTDEGSEWAPHLVQDLHSSVGKAPRCSLRRWSILGWPVALADEGGGDQSPPPHAHTHTRAENTHMQRGTHV